MSGCITVELWGGPLDGERRTVPTYSGNLNLRFAECPSVDLELSVSPLGIRLIEHTYHISPVCRINGDCIAVYRDSR
jgi:hypothetical protein